MNELVEKIVTILEGFNGARSIKQKARAVVELKVISNSADRLAEQYKESLMKAEVYELFPEYEMKVEYSAPKSSSYIDAVKLAKKLIKDDRLNDLLKIITVSEKDLKTIMGGEVLVEKYKVAGEDTKAGLKVSKMTKIEITESVPQK